MFYPPIMKRVLLLSLLCILFIEPNKVAAQTAFTPISRSLYNDNQEFFDKYFDDYAYSFVNFMMSYSLVSQPFEALSIRLSENKSGGIITVRTIKKNYIMECSPELYSSLILLTKHAVNTASYTMNRKGIDGADFYLFLNDNGVTNWSPDGLSDQAIRLFEHIGTSVMAGDRECLESFTAVADYLYHEFKANYHESMLQTGNSLSRSSENDYTLSLYADLGSSISELLFFQLYCGLGGFQVQFKFDHDSFNSEIRKQYRAKYENLLREIGYWVYAQSDFADDSNYATFIVSENVSDPVVFESDKCRFIIHLKESDLVADKMISLLEGVHKNRRISFLNDDIVKPTGSADITADQVDAKLKEPITARIKTPIPKSMKERLGYESHPDESAAVDLGLSVKWAPFNIGAEKPEDNGDYFSWGETEPKSRYGFEDYILGDATDFWEMKFYKYNNDTIFGTVDGRTVLEPQDDAAHVKWGGGWRMPTKAEWEELRNCCTWTWDTVSGVSGLRIISNKPGYTDRSIFLPAASYCTGDIMNHSDYEMSDYMSWYWSSTLSDTDGPEYTGSLLFDSNSISWGGHRVVGASIRPVVPGTASVVAEPKKEKVEIDDICYNIYPKTKTAYVTSGDIYIADVEIPSKIKYKGKTYRVTGIDSGAFKEECFITSVSIPESVTEICDSAFYRCTDLTEVNIPEGVTRIGRFTFAGCESLDSIAIPESVTLIDIEAFTDCPALKK